MDESTARSRHPDSIGQAFLLALPTLFLVLHAPDATYAQVVTNSIDVAHGGGER